MKFVETFFLLFFWISAVLVFVLILLYTIYLIGMLLYRLLLRKTICLNVPNKMLLAVFLTIIVSMLFYGGMNYAGFCFQEFRFLSDQEKIDAGIWSTLWRYSKKGCTVTGVDGKLVPEDQRIIIFRDRDYQERSDIERFKQENPDCCSLTKFDGEYKINFWNRVFGEVNTFVWVEFKYKETNGTEKVGYDLIPISNCGKEILSPIEAIGF